MHPYVHCSIIYNSQDMEVPIDERIKKMWYINTIHYYSAIRKNEILPFVTKWMVLEGIMLSEIRQGKTHTI